MIACIPRCPRLVSRVPFVLVVLLMPWSAGCSREESRPSHEEIVGAEFEAILELHEQTCGGVINFKKIDKFVYEVTCANGEVYRTDVSHEGHVNVSADKP